MNMANTPDIKAKSKTFILPYFLIYGVDREAKIDEHITPIVTIISPRMSIGCILLKLPPNATKIPNIANKIANNLNLVIDSILNNDEIINVQIGIVAKISPARPAVVKVKPQVNKIGKPAK